MRKTTAYARKHRRTGGLYNGAEWMNTINRSRPYTDDEVPELGLYATQDAAVKAVVLVRTALEAMATGATPAGNVEHFDLLSHALGVSCIRAAQIAGPEVDVNPMLTILVAGNATLRTILARRRRWNKWQMLPGEREAIADAVDVYETILMASSPQQMNEAVQLRMKALKGQTLETLEDA